MTSSSPHRYRLGVLLGDGIGLEIVPSSRRRSRRRAGGRRSRPSRVGRAPDRPRRDRRVRRPHPRVDPGRAGRPRRLAARPARQRGLPGALPEPAQPQRDHPQALRPVRQHPPGEGVRGRQGRGARYRPRDRPGEHRGLLRRPQHLRRHRRVHADAGRRDRHGHHHPPGLRADRPLGLRAGSAAQQEADDRAQGQRAQADHRAVPRRLPRGRRRTTRTCRSTTSTSTP